MLAVYFTHVVVCLCNKSAFTRTLQSLVATVVYYMWGFFNDICGSVSESSFTIP